MRWRISEGVRHRKAGDFLDRTVVIELPPDVLVVSGAPGSTGVEVGLFRAIRVIHVRANPDFSW
jgi:hypothetical protein